MRPDDSYKVLAAFAFLGVDLNRRLNVATDKEKIDAFEQAKKDAKVEFKKKAFELHPDRNKDPLAEDKFKLLSAAMQLIEQVKLAIQPPPVTRIHIVMHPYSTVNMYSNTSATSGTTTAGGWYSW